VDYHYSRGTRILLAPTGRYNSLHYHFYTAPIRPTFVFSAPNFTLFSHKLHTHSCRRTSIFPVRDVELEHVEMGTRSIDPKDQSRLPLMHCHMRTADPRHEVIATSQHTSTHADSSRHRHTSRLAAQPKQLAQRHSSDELTNTIQKFEITAVTSLLSIVYCAIFIYSIVFKGPMCPPSHVHYGVYDFVVRKFS
jgi:hypothetical protein